MDASADLDPAVGRALLSSTGAYTIETPTLGFRYATDAGTTTRPSRLQQLWRIVSKDTATLEWRDVPTEVV